MPMMMMVGVGCLVRTHAARAKLITLSSFLCMSHQQREPATQISTRNNMNMDTYSLRSEAVLNDKSYAHVECARANDPTMKTTHNILA